MGDFAQRTTPVGVLQGILGSYPYSVGQLREILQNSDDAKASKQVLVLDRRNHTTGSLYARGLAATQGPALLAYNDAIFSATDWEALQSTYESSKVDDSSKIGKYGVGFRSLFHITDCPQIVSGDVFAMFDPLRAFTHSAGQKLDLARTLADHPGQLTSFSSLLPPSIHTHFNGTIIRCPLRNEASHISAKVTQPEDISHLFSKFIAEEIDISLLFLQHIKEIEVRDIDEHGTQTILAQLSITRSPPTTCGTDNALTHTATVSLIANGKHTEVPWRILQCSFEYLEEFDFPKALLSGMHHTLKKHKLRPDVGIAVPRSMATEQSTSGRLFTFLPLPLPTKFPVHVHAYFALTQSRQNLRNSREIGLVPGSDDYMLVKWNELLFTQYIPRAWRKLLEVLVAQHDPGHIFNTWPPAQGRGSSGESVYWETLPAQILSFATAARSAIWPIYDPNASPPASQTVFQPLDTVIVADPGVPVKILSALTAVGLRFTRPPRYIFDLMKAMNIHINVPISILTPNEAHKKLLRHTVALQMASKSDIDMVLEYLVSTKDIQNVVGLPVLRSIANVVVALSLRGPSSLVVHTLLTRKEFDVFGACDDDAIPLHLLPNSVATVLQSQGPALLNVETLTVQKVIDYLVMYPNKLGLDLSRTRTDPRARDWLSAFWIWQDQYVNKAELLSKIQHLFLLPSAQGLRKVDAPLFRLRGAHPTTVAHLTTLGIPFIDDKLPERAQAILATCGLLKNVTDVYAILDTISSTSDVSPTLTKDGSTAILTYLAFNIRERLSHERIQQLKRLPIYPIVKLDSLSLEKETTYQSLPEGSTIKCIEASPFPLVPAIPGTIFVQFTTPKAASVLDFIQPHERGLSDLELLELTVKNFLDQPEHIHAKTVQYIHNHRSKVPPLILETLQQTSFVAVEDGSRRKPKEVIDPDSPIACLYASNPERQARRSTPSEIIIIQSLRSLKQLEHTLTCEMVRERIEKIAGDPSFKTSLDLSKALLDLVVKTHLDYSRLSVSPEQRWLPTSQGLRSHTECRDTNHLSRNLFDEVLAVFDQCELPTSLRKVLGWDQPLSVHVLTQQLDHILRGGRSTFSIVSEIIKEITCCTMTDDEYEILRTVTREKIWIPTSNGQLSDTASAIFSAPIPGSGFAQIYHVDKGTRDFLRMMGCMDMPSTSVVIEKLTSLSLRPPSLDIVNSSLRLLESLPSILTDEERLQVLVPDTNCTLQRFADTYFNDIGDQASLIPAERHFTAHPLLEESLAQQLGLGRLGLKYMGLGIPGVEMGEKPVVTVRKTLSQYTERQFVTEFLANAADAKATEFTLLVNSFSTDDSAQLRALDAKMATFCSVPSLVVHNNSTFSDKDFTGICQTSVGGKSGQRETIGQFGLGALTMFHFTELAIIISNTTVLFLNPSKSHLPYDRAALMLPLNHVRMFFPRHLYPVHGLFEFDILSQEPYNGTIFILPLRTESHCEGSGDFISPKNHKYWTTAQVENDILSELHESASNCLIFTHLDHISGEVRDFSGHQTQSWTFKAERDHIYAEPDTGFMLSNISITDMSTLVTTVWTVANTSARNMEQQKPEDLVRLASERRLRTPTAGLATRFDSHSQGDVKFKFFSALPLAIPTCLPVHVNASFILASDRRQIRQDEYDGPVTRYNKWLLTEIIPPLYYFLLGWSLRLGNNMDNKWWWPRHGSDDNAHSRLIVESFYDNLAACNRQLFRSAYHPGTALSPGQAVLIAEGEISPSIEAALVALEPVEITQVSKKVYHLATERDGIFKVNPMFLKGKILQNPSLITNLPFKVVEEIIKFLSPDIKDDAPPPSPTYLVGLPILPLDDKSFGTITELDPRTRPYFVWRPKSNAARPHSFPPQYFVHRRLKASELLKARINVAPLNIATMKELIDECLEGSTPFETLSPHISRRIEDFWGSWDEYTHLKLSPSDISEFPLVPTLDANIYVSLDDCRDGTVVIAGGSTQTSEQLRACLRKLRLTVVRSDQEPTPEPLRHILSLEEYPKLSFETVLARLQAIHGDNLAEKFDEIETEYQEAFASWARLGVQNIPDHLMPVAQRLPIWPSMKRGCPEKLRSSLEITMLPDNLPLHLAGRFMGTFVAAHGQLGALNRPILLRQVGEYLDLPTIMDASEIPLYRDFLCAWVPRLPTDYIQSIIIPNSSRTMVPSGTLYARGVLFESVFGHDSDYLLAQEFTRMQHNLYKHQLRHEGQLDIPMFRVCCEAVINQQDGTVPTDRAAALFEAYTILLPMNVNHNDQDIWHDLDELSFIPRRMATIRRLDDQQQNNTGLTIPSRVTTLPYVVSPLNLVRKEFEAIAWTQRAMFDVQPHNRILLSYPEFGRPDISDVILHLKVLASMTYLSDSQQTVFIHDLAETYTFLENNIVLATEQERSQLAEGALFLNVENPASDNWIWNDCNHLVFETHDTEASLRYVRSFLKPFSKLLCALGVLEVHHPRYISDHTVNSDSAKLDAIRRGFDQQRGQNRLTDVVFLPGTMDESDFHSVGDKSAPLVAHRAFLAVVSDHFCHMFCSDYTESGFATAQDPIKIDVPDQSRECIQSVLDYIYTGIQSMENASLKLLLKIMELSGFWRITDLFEDIQKEIVLRRLITPLTLSEIKDAAKRATAENLIRACEEYEVNNPTFISKVLQSMAVGNEGDS